MTNPIRLKWDDLRRSAKARWSAFRRAADLRKTDLQREAPRSVWLSALIITVVAYVVSFAIAHMGDDAFHHENLVFWSAFVGAAVGIELFLIIAYLVHKRRILHLFDPLPKGKDVGVVIFCALVVGALAIVFTGMDADQALKNPGGLFLLIFSVLSMVSFWAGFSSLLEFRRVITSFQQLHGRLLQLISETDAPHTVKMLAYTPAIGFLALKADKWKDLREAFEGLKGRLEIVCLDEEDLRSWHGLYKGRKTLRAPHRAVGASRREIVEARLSDEDIEDATNAAKDILALPGVSEKCARKKLEMMPGFYLIFNDHKAIIVSPFFTPYPFGTPGAIQRSPTEVQMFGVETTDSSVIKNVEEIFQAYKTDVPPGPSKFFSSKKALQRDEALQCLTSHCRDLASFEGSKMHFRLSVFEDS